jgi:CHAT domain-containing protein/tetratricopeptide (TPR) repeat protein
MTEAELVEQLLNLPDVAAQKQFLKDHTLLINDKVADLLKIRANHFLRADIYVSLQIADHLCYIAELTGDPIYRALGLVLEADARSIGLGEYDSGIALYNTGIEIYHNHGRFLEEAWAQIGKVNALSYIGRYTEAIEIGLAIGRVFEDNERWRSLAVLTMNLGIVYGRWGKDLESLAMFDRAGEIYLQMGIEGQAHWALIQQNRAVALRNLGRFEASMQASEMARDTLHELHESVEAARAEQGLALTYFVLGRFNEALKLLDQVRDVFMADRRKRDVMLVELYISDCLLELRRFSEALEKCHRVRELFAELGSMQLAGLAIINEAVAYAELRRYDEALKSLDEARQIFVDAGNEVLVASTDLERAAVLLCQTRYVDSLTIAKECVIVFKSHDTLIEQAQSLIVAARASLALKQYLQLEELVAEALQIAENLNVPTVRYQGHSLLASLAVAKGDLSTAEREYECAIQEVEQLRGRLMVEFRVSFLENKEILYQDMVELSLDQDQPLRALEYAERAKSRALLDLLAYRLDLTFQAKDATDAPLIEQLTTLRVERDRLYRRWESDADTGERGWSSSESVRQKAQQEVLALETRITELWHRLLVRNADYAREASLWTVRTESAQPYLDKDTLLLEYYVLRGRLVVFFVTDTNVQARRLDSDLSKIQTLMQRFQLNIWAVPKSSIRQVAALTINAQAILHQLYELLIAPIEDQIEGYSKLIIVPHGPLHYLPFHALYNRSSYLIEGYEISYLPNASSLRYCCEVQPGTAAGIAIGNSNGGRLPYAVEEARRIAALLNGQAFLEEQASIRTLYQDTHECQVLHLATHGDFRLDNPLFSGLALADGWLTTMDIFNLRLSASLVTLSACQTGRNVVGGGDELLGLMRAFLSAGAASIMLTLWAVEDRSTGQIMELFYRKLVDGSDKRDALRYAQLSFISGTNSSLNMQPEHLAHPYFWAPFFLVGDAGPL